MRQIIVIALTALICTVPLRPVLALEVDRAVAPRITVGGRLLATPRYDEAKGFDGQSDEDASDIDISDSSIMARFDKRIYSQQGVAGATIGIRKVGFESEVEGDVFFNQLNATFWNRSIDLVVGQTRQRNFVVELPTLRDEDLLAYAYVPDASSFREAEEDTLFAPIAAVQWYPNGGRNALTSFVGAQARTDLSGDPESPEINSVGLGWAYHAPEAMHLVEHTRAAGVRLFYQDVDESLSPSGDTGMYSLIAGGEWTLNRDPSRVWAVGVQGIYSEGLEDVEFDPLASEGERIGALNQAQSWALTGFLTYTGRPKLLTRTRYGLVFGIKDYPDETDARSYAIIPNFVWRIGHAIDLVAQYKYEALDDGLAAMTGFEYGQSIQVGLVFGFDKTFNDQIGERSSILNMEHGYIR
jgi:hypothetical protein